MIHIHILDGSLTTNVALLLLSRIYNKFAIRKSDGMQHEAQAGLGALSQGMA